MTDENKLPDLKNDKPRMFFGKISAALLSLAVATILLLLLIKPGGGDSSGALGGCFTMLSVPAAVVLGILGIILDQRKWLAILTTIITGSLVAIYIILMVISMSRFAN